MEKLNQFNNLDLASDLAQFYSLFLLLKDATNADVIKKLEHQEKNYLEDIVNRLDIMEKRLTAIEEKIK